MCWFVSDPNQGMYPASAIKLTYLLAAMEWCQSQNLPFTCLEPHVRPMITVSDNLETGIIVDIVSGAPNIVNLTKPSDPRFAPWVRAKAPFVATGAQMVCLLSRRPSATTRRATWTPSGCWLIKSSCTKPSRPTPAKRQWAQNRSHARSME
jgi:hypothetical protein